MMIMIVKIYLKINVLYMNMQAQKEVQDQVELAIIMGLFCLGVIKEWAVEFLSCPGNVS